MDQPSPPSFFQRHECLIRRLHSLSGLIPVGAFVCIHLLTNASVVGGAASFQEKVDLIHSLGPALPLVEWTFIFLPILFHAIVGVVIIRSGQSNAVQYSYPKNIRYTLQRATAWIALFFIAWHVFHMHGWIKFESLEPAIQQAGGAQFDPHRATSTAALALSSPIYTALYVIGVLATVFHLANGIWTMGVSWGAWTSPAAQRRADYVCAAFGILLAVVGLSAVVGFKTADVPRAEAYEQARIEAEEELARRQQEILEQRKASPRQASQVEPANSPLVESSATAPTPHPEGN